MREIGTTGRNSPNFVQIPCSEWIVRYIRIKLREYLGYFVDMCYAVYCNIVSILLSLIGGRKMAISYNKLWKLLIDKKMTQAELRKAANIAPNPMTKLRRDEPVNLAILGRACAVLGCDIGDVMEFIPDEEQV